jgi:hypothetical protein
MKPSERIWSERNGLGAILDELWAAVFPEREEARAVSEVPPAKECHCGECMTYARQFGGLRNPDHAAVSEARDGGDAHPDPLGELRALIVRLDVARGTKAGLLGYVNALVSKYETECCRWRQVADDARDFNGWREKCIAEYGAHDASRNTIEHLRGELEAAEQHIKILRAQHEETERDRDFWRRSHEEDTTNLVGGITALRAKLGETETAARENAQRAVDAMNENRRLRAQSPDELQSRIEAAAQIMRAARQRGPGLSLAGDALEALGFDRDGDEVGK